MTAGVGLATSTMAVVKSMGMSSGCCNDRLEGGGTGGERHGCGDGRGDDVLAGDDVVSRVVLPLSQGDEAEEGDEEGDEYLPASARSNRVSLPFVTALGELFVGHVHGSGMAAASKGLSGR